MRMLPIADSSNVAAVGYDADPKTLRVEFRNGSIYEYTGVPAQQFGELCAAPSVGRYHNESIKRYPHRQIRGPREIEQSSKLRDVLQLIGTAAGQLMNHEHCPEPVLDGLRKIEALAAEAVKDS